MELRVGNALKHPPENIRYEYLDLLRFLAALFVLSLHWGFAMQSYKHGSVASLSYLHPVGKIAKYGLLGVDVFFMLSGAVISMSALNKRPGSFVIARFVRLFPSFILIIPVAIIVARFISAADSRSYLGSAGMRELLFSINLSNWTFGVPQAAEGATWTLWVEVRFYILIYIVLSLLALLNRKLEVRSLLAFGYIWYAFSMLAIESNNGFLRTVLITDYSPYFLVGMSIAVISLYPEYRRSTYPLLFFASIASIHQLQVRLAGLSDLIGIIIFFSAAIFIAFAFKKRPKNTWIKRLYVTGGALSYPLYLAHDRIGGALLAFLDSRSQNHLLNMTLATGILCAILLIWTHKLEPKISKEMIRKLKTEWE